MQRLRAHTFSSMVSSAAVASSSPRVCSIGGSCCTTSMLRRIPTSVVSSAAATMMSSSAMCSQMICTANRTQMRSYFAYQEGFVPEGARTSMLHSSSVPSERVRVMREYALAPLFGARRPACVLGSLLPRTALMSVKAQLPAVIAKLLDVDVADITLGPIEMLQNRLMHRPGDDLCPRYTEGQCVATSLIAVYINDHIVSEEDSDSLGEVLLAMFQLGEAKVLVESGISHVEMRTEDASGYTFDSIGGEEISEVAADDIARRWQVRQELLEQQQQQQQQQQQGVTSNTLYTSS